jgi:hypothetical protein
MYVSIQRKSTSHLVWKKTASNVEKTTEVKRVVCQEKSFEPLHAKQAEI